MAHAAIYVRVSTSRQAERDLSLPDQIAQCRAYCERQGWEVAEIFTEAGGSALDEDRPVFREMISKATTSVALSALSSCLRWPASPQRVAFGALGSQTPRQASTRLRRSSRRRPTRGGMSESCGRFRRASVARESEGVYRAMLENARQVPGTAPALLRL